MIRVSIISNGKTQYDVEYMGEQRVYWSIEQAIDGLKELRELYPPTDWSDFDEPMTEQQKNQGIIEFLKGVKYHGD